MFIKNDYSKKFNGLDAVRYFTLRSDIKLINHDQNRNSYIFRIQPRKEIILVKLLKEIGNPILDYTVKQIKADIYFGDGKRYMEVTGYFKHLPNDFYHGLKYRKEFNYQEPIIISIDASHNIKMITTKDIPININLHD